MKLMKILFLFLCISIFNINFIYADNILKKIQLKIDCQELKVGDKKIEYNGTSFFDNGEGIIYCHIRSIPEILQEQNLNLIWNQETKSAFLRYAGKNTNEMEFVQSDNKIIIHNKIIVNNKILQKNNQMYIPVDLLSKAFDVDIQIVSDYDDLYTILADEDKYTYRKLGYLRNDFEAVGKYIQQNIDANFVLHKFSKENWKPSKINVERLSTCYLLEEFETDFGYLITSVNGQVIEIRRNGVPLYDFNGKVPDKEKVDTIIGEIQKQYDTRDNFIKQDILKKYDSVKNNFYLNIYFYDKEKEIPIREIYYFVVEDIPYSFQKSDLNNIENYIKKNINEKFILEQYQARMLKKEYNYVIISLKEKIDEPSTKAEYYVVIENNKVVGIYTVGIN